MPPILASPVVNLSKTGQGGGPSPAPPLRLTGWPVYKKLCSIETDTHIVLSLIIWWLYLLLLKFLYIDLFWLFVEKMKCEIPYFHVHWIVPWDKVEVKDIQSDSEQTLVLEVKASLYEHGMEWIHTIIFCRRCCFLFEFIRWSYI